MTTEPSVAYDEREGVAHIRMDDGRVNALSPDLQAEILGAFERADRDDAVNMIVLEGRDRVFSGGFDLAVMAGADQTTIDMVIGGFTLARRILTIAKPVLMVSRGHAMAMGAFLLLAGDYRLAAADHGTYQANEVAIGLTVPHAALELLRSRLEPAAFDRAACVSAPFTAAAACRAGFVDEVVDRVELDARTAEIVASFQMLDPAAHRGTKERARRALLARLDDAIAADRLEFEALFAAA